LWFENWGTEKKSTKGHGRDDNCRSKPFFKGCHVKGKAAIQKP